MKKKNTHVLYGFTTVIVMIIIGMSIIYAGWTFRFGISYLVYLPFLIGIILNAIAYSKANDGYVNFGDVFGSCFKAVVIIMIVRLAWIPVSDYFFPGIKEKVFTMIHEKLLSNPGMPEDKAETVFNIISKGWIIIMIFAGIISTLFFGVIFSLIASAIAHKKGTRPPITGDNF